MPGVDQLLSRNGARTAGAGDLSAVPAAPSLRTAVVTCMDARIDPRALFGLATGEVHVIRNAGGVVTDEVVRSLAVSQQWLGTTEVLLAQHTGCGMATMSDEDVLDRLEEIGGARPAWAPETFTDLDASVRTGLARLRSSPYLGRTEVLRGFVVDLAAGGALREVG